jgi:ketosteroid isomerase-like protein
MSDESLDVVRAYFQARRERGREGVFEFLSPEVEWRARSDLPDTQTYTGHDGVRQLFGRFRDVLDDMWFDPLDFLVVGDEVVVPLRWGGRGKGSGVVVEEGETWIFTVRDAIIVRVTECATLEEAVEAARALGPAHGPD